MHDHGLQESSVGPPPPPPPPPRRVRRCDLARVRQEYSCWRHCLRTAPMTPNCSDVLPAARPNQALLGWRTSLAKALPKRMPRASIRKYFISSTGSMQRALALRILLLDRFPCNGHPLAPCAKLSSASVSIRRSIFRNPRTMPLSFRSDGKPRRRPNCRRRRKPGVKIFRDASRALDRTFLRRSGGGLRSASFYARRGRGARPHLSWRLRPVLSRSQLRTGALNLPWQPEERSCAFHRLRVLSVPVIALGAAAVLDGFVQDRRRLPSQSHGPYHDSSG